MIGYDLHNGMALHWSACLSYFPSHHIVTPSRSCLPPLLQPSWRVQELEEAFPEGLGGAYCLMLTMVMSALSREKGEAIKQLLQMKVGSGRVELSSSCCR